MKSWAERIRLRMKELDMTQEMLASKMGITRGAVTHYLAGRRVPPLNQFQKLAAVLKVDPAWLQFGVEADIRQGSKKIAGKSEKTANAKIQIPVLRWEQVLDFVGTIKIPATEIREFIPHFFINKPRWYALRIQGDVMTSPHGKGFHEDELILVDPEKPAKHGSYVVAVLPKTKEATFKQYVIDGALRYLKPLNPQYPTTQIDASTHICGVIVGCIRNIN